MKFLTLERGQLGVLVDEAVVDVPQASTALGMPCGIRSLSALLESGDVATERAWAVAEQALKEGLTARALSDVKPLAPIPRPKRNIFCLGKNYGDHAREMVGKVGKGGAIPEKPIFFTKATTSVIGPGVPIPRYPRLTSKLDYEAELAIIIGKEGRDISADEAMKYVFGYTALNDITARDLQIDHGQWFRGKSLDGFAPMGPVVVHRSVMPPPEEIEVKCWVNAEQRQRGTLADLIFDVPATISSLSAGLTLLAGDIIATGTPAGVGMGFSPPRYLKKGDEVTVEVTGAGQLINRVA